MSSPGAPGLTKASTTTATTDSIAESLPLDPPPPPPLPQLHAAAQTGDVQLIRELLTPSDEPSSSTAVRADVNDKDPQGISALHWAAINNHLLVCKFLLEQGAEVDARGGDLDATPLHWAARNGHLYIVHLLIKYNADPTLLDSQSFNALHLAVHSSSAFLLAYILFTSQPVAIDSADTEGHTGLHWACYQGDAISVDLLLRAGADAKRADNAGLTPLHWAAVKGNAACIKRVLEAGGDISAREKQGKTPKDMATELKSLPAFKRGLLDAGFDEEGRIEVGTFRPRTTKIAIFALPTACFFLMLNTLAILPWWSGLLLAFAEFFGMHHVVSKVLLDIKGPHNTDRLTKSNYLCSVIVASIIWVVYVWLTRFVHLSGYAITNLICGISILVCCYNFFRAITLDPGHVPLAINDAETKEMVEDLVEIGSFNGMNFCLSCLIRRPLRSKHSYVTKRCTARFDHYCPWVWNDIGVNNHRQFLLFVATLVSSIMLFIRLAIGYYTEKAPEAPAEAYCTNVICTAAQYDTFALAVVFWSALQLSWTIILLGAQLWQVCRQMTTLEVSNVGRYGYMGGKPGISAAGQQGFIEKYTQTPADGGAEGHTHGPACNHGGKKSGGAKKAPFLFKILGIDRFTNGKAAEGLAKAGKVTNPFDLGLVKNCYDFWGRGRELGVEYTRLYEVPTGGFAKAVRDRKRREKEDRETGKANSASRPRTTQGYERLGMEEV
ncbi:Palmitoyltransferase AKR1 [Pseudohyphozyma bogoriensis]|nr:Palmitoyltransferase AKR1 [Pseudohyphozyma bogoriensis]